MSECDFIVTIPKELTPPTIKKPDKYFNYTFNLPCQIDSIGDLIKFSKDDPKFNYIINSVNLKRIEASLEKLDGFIGLEDIKSQIFNLIIYILVYDDNKDLLHTVIQGPPGVGKTEIAKILGEIYSHMGFLSKGHFSSVTRSDLIGEYLGQTAKKTQGVLDAAKGGVLFIDEAYSLGNSGEKDMYSKECIDTINTFLSENRNDFVMIIAGYENSLETCFFSHNRGLERRFPYRFTIKEYTTQQLSDIFRCIVEKQGWKCDAIVFDENLVFKQNGGDMEKLFHLCKISHVKNLLKNKNLKKRLITQKDVDSNVSSFKKQDSEYNNLYL